MKKGNITNSITYGVLIGACIFAVYCIATAAAVDVDAAANLDACEKSCTDAAIKSINLVGCCDSYDSLDRKFCIENARSVYDSVMKCSNCARETEAISIDNNICVSAALIQLAVFRNHEIIYDDGSCNIGLFTKTAANSMYNCFSAVTSDQSADSIIFPVVQDSFCQRS